MTAFVYHQDGRVWEHVQPPGSTAAGSTWSSVSSSPRSLIPSSSAMRASFFFSDRTAREVTCADGVSARTSALAKAVAMASWSSPCEAKQREGRLRQGTTGLFPPFGSGEAREARAARAARAWISDLGTQEVDLKGLVSPSVSHLLLVQHASR